MKRATLAARVVRQIAAKALVRIMLGVNLLTQWVLVLARIMLEDKKLTQLALVLVWVVG